MININISPCVYSFGFYKIHFYGLVAFVGIIIFYFFLVFDKNRPKVITQYVVLDLLMESLLIGIVSSKFLFITENFNLFLQHAEKNIFFSMSNGGFSMLGSMIGIPIYLYFRTSFTGINFWLIADLFARNVPIFQMIARVGCLGVGCCTGIELSKEYFFSVCYSHPDACATLNTPLLPNPIFSILMSLIIYLFLSKLSSSIFQKKGTTFGAYLTLEGLSRFIVDIWRISYDRTIIFTTKNFLISFNQIIALIVLFSGLSIFFIKFNTHQIKNHSQR